jgi:hypothetical protein
MNHDQQGNWLGLSHDSLGFIKTAMQARTAHFERKAVNQSDTWRRGAKDLANPFALLAQRYRRQFQIGAFSRVSAQGKVLLGKWMQLHETPISGIHG